jgi:transposase InsO family protein
MNEELGYQREREEENPGGEGSLEWSERSERNGSEPSPPTRSPEGNPPDESGPEGGGAREVSGPEPIPVPSPDVADTPAPDPDESAPGDAELSDEEWETAWQSRQHTREEAPEEAEGWEVTPMPPNLTARRRGTLSKPSRRSQVPLSPQQKLLLLDTWQRSGLPARDFAALVQVSHHTLYGWRKKFEELGPAGLMDRPKGAKTGSRLPELTKRSILMLKQSHPDWGCQRISDMLLRGPALPASPSAVARVLHEAGYEMEEMPTRTHKAPVRSFERAKPNQLWQTDLFTFMLKRQNRRVYLVAFMDDHSRFVTGYGLHASQSATLVIEVLRAAIAAYGVPEEILTDNGSQYITWRGKSQFTRELEKRGIRQIVARPRRPQTLGKIERFWGSLWRECVETAVFLDLADARQRIGLWIDHYNLQRPHQGIEGLVPADRFFQAAPEVLRTLKRRVAANARELARHGVPKKPFYLTGQVEGKPFSVHREGDRVILHRAGEAREDIDLKRPRHERTDEVPSGKAQDELPPSVCPDGSPLSLWQHQSREPAPGTSPVDAFVKADERVKPDGPQTPQPPNTSAEEGGDA